MSQTNLDDIDIPEEDVIDQGAQGKARKTGLSPAAKIGMMISAGLATIGLAYAFTGNAAVEPSVTARPPSIDATPGGQIQSTSAEYRESIRQENERRADLANQMGITFTPTPEIALQPRPMVTVSPTETVAAEPASAPVVPERQETRRILPPAPPPAAPLPPQAPVEVQAPVQPQIMTSQAAAGEENPYLQNMLNQMNVVSDRQKPRSIISDTVSRSDRAPAQQQEALATGMMAGDQTVSTEEMIFRPGDVLYGETLTSVSSDNEAPVLVEIVSGPQKGARLVGNIAADRRSEDLVVNFTNMTLADGTVLAINAFAVDGKSAEMAVSSDIERRYLKRYGPILAAAFISSYAQARSEPARSIVGVGQDVQIDRERPTVEQSLFAGLSAATDVIAEDILASAPVGPKINLRAGFPIAVLMVDPVVSEKAPASDAAMVNPAIAIR